MGKMNEKKRIAQAGLLLLLLLAALGLSGCGTAAAEPGQSAAPGAQGQKPPLPEKLELNAQGVPLLRVYQVDEEAVQEMNVEDYLLGVLAGEMKNDWPLEALKAQAAAERTYVYYQLAQGRKDAHPDADFCTDHTCCSAYLSETAAKEKWAADFAPWNTRVVQAVADTDGLVALYDGEPILAVFHSSSAGRTAAAGDVWSGDLPYLASVASPESADTVPNYYSTVTFTAAEAKDLLLAAHPEIKLTGAPETWFGAVTENDSGRVETVSVAGTDIEGTEMRRIFSLRSACFTLTADAESVTFRVTGYGHGVGMSQYGAEQLAKAGKTWQEILAWYYTGVTIGPAG